MKSLEQFSLVEPMLSMLVTTKIIHQMTFESTVRELLHWGRTTANMNHQRLVECARSNPQGKHWRSLWCHVRSNIRRALRIESISLFSTDSLLPCNSDVHESKLLCGIRRACQETRLPVEKDELTNHGVATLQHQALVSGIVICSTKHSSAQSCFATPNIHNGQRAL